MNSRDKGARGERELANLLRKKGYDARRGQQYCGANGDADVVGLDGIHIEVKRTERFRPYEAMHQSLNDAREDELSTVFYRSNKRGWLVMMTMDEFMELYERSKNAKNNKN